MLLWIILFATAGSVLSMVGGVILLWRTDIARKASLFLISFAAGVLLGVAFLDLLPEAYADLGNIELVATVMVIAIIVYFILERVLWWYHHHRMHTDEHRDTTGLPGRGISASKAYLLLAGDSIHNFMDGILIAAAFLVDFSLGVAVSVGVIAHELPQEIADFGIMIDAGFSRVKTLALNFAAALTTLVGALVAFFVLPSIEGMLPHIIAFAAGIFVYISLSDLIPEIHHRSEHRHIILHLFLFVSGIVLVGWLI